MGWVYAGNALAAADPESYVEIRGLLKAEILTDLEANNRFWDQYEGKVADAAEAVNDTYLKANSQEHGVESYGMAVDLMLGWFEETVPCEGGRSIRLTIIFPSLILNVIAGRRPIFRMRSIDMRQRNFGKDQFIWLYVYLFLYDNIPGPPDTVLIIDDDEINRAILDNLFSETYVIQEAENGRIGLEKILAQRDRICAVLLDVVMPEMDGIQVMRALNERNIQEQIPVFLITAEASDTVMREAYELGVMDVISKPVVPYVVRRRVNSVVELFQARKRLGNVVDQQQTELLRQARLIIDLNMGMIESLSTAIEFRSGESGEHVRRIHDITKYMLTHTPLGRGLSEQDIDWISMAAIMHDVGKNRHSGRHFK